MRKILSALSLTLALLSCTTEENPTTPTNEQFSIYVEKDYKVDSQIIYAILHNNEGNVIDYKEVFNDDTLKFTLPESSTYHLTIYKNEIYEGIDYNTLNTFTDIPTGQSITLGLPKESTLISAELSDSFEVTVNHQGSLKFINVSNAIGNKSTSSSISNNIARAQMQSNKGLDEHLISVMDIEGKTYYKTFFLENEKNNYSFNLDEFKNYDFEVQIENKELSFSNFQVQGMVFRDVELKRAFSTSVFITSFSGIESEKYSLGYLNRYPLFETNITARVKNNTNQLLSISSRSSAPPVLDLATPQTLQIQSKKISDFSLILPANFERWNAQWIYIEDDSISMSWRVLGNVSKIPEFELPEVLIEQNQKLQKSLELKLSSVTVIKGKFTYEEWLQDEFVERNNPLEFQQVSWSESY